MKIPCAKRQIIGILLKWISILFILNNHEDDFSQIHKPINQFQIKSGDKLYSAGDEATCLFTLRSGLVKLVQYLPDGTQK